MFDEDGGKPTGVEGLHEAVLARPMFTPTSAADGCFVGAAEAEFSQPLGSEGGQGKKKKEAAGIHAILPA
jgi:hypothetical protein